MSSVCQSFAAIMSDVAPIDRSFFLDPMYDRNLVFLIHNYVESDSSRRERRSKEVSMVTISLGGSCYVRDKREDVCPCVVVSCDLCMYKLNVVCVCVKRRSNGEIMMLMGSKAILCLLPALLRKERKKKQGKREEESFSRSES